MDLIIGRGAYAPWCIAALNLCCVSMMAMNRVYGCKRVNGDIYKAEGVNHREKVENRMRKGKKPVAKVRPP